MGQFTEHEWRDLEQMWFRTKNSVIFELITLLRANQIAGITSGFKMDIMKFYKKETINNTRNIQPFTIVD